MKGYITLTTVIILGAVALSVVTSLMLIGVSSSRSSALSVHAIEAESAMSSCMSNVLLNVKNNNALTGSGNMDIYGINCDYNIIDVDLNKKTVELSLVNKQVYIGRVVNIEITDKVRITSYKYL